MFKSGSIQDQAGFRDLDLTIYSPGDLLPLLVLLHSRRIYTPRHVEIYKQETSGVRYPCHRWGYRRRMRSSE